MNSDRAKIILVVLGLIVAFALLWPESPDPIREFEDTCRHDCYMTEAPPDSLSRCLGWCTQVAEEMSR